MVVTTEDAGSEGAACDPQVVGVFLGVQLVHVQVPQTHVSVGGAAHEHLTAGAEGAGYHCGVIHGSGPSQTQPTEQLHQRANLVSPLFKYSITVGGGTGRW